MGDKASLWSFIPRFTRSAFMFLLGAAPAHCCLFVWEENLSLTRDVLFQVSSQEGHRSDAQCFLKKGHPSFFNCTMLPCITLLEMVSLSACDQHFGGHRVPWSCRESLENSCFSTEDFVVWGQKKASRNPAPVRRRC